jgi:hypothetical protein
MGCCCKCSDNGCFVHASFLLLGWEFGGSRDVCECIVPCCSYLKVPRMTRAEICCYSFTQVEEPALPQDYNVPLDIQCMSNLYVCSFAYGQYMPETLSTNMTNMGGPTRTSPPKLQIVTKALGPRHIPGVGTPKAVATPGPT